MDDLNDLNNTNETYNNNNDSNDNMTTNTNDNVIIRPDSSQVMINENLLIFVIFIANLV